MVDSLPQTVPETSGWASRDCYQMLDQRVQVRSTSVKFGTQLRRLWRSFPTIENQTIAPDFTISVFVAPTSETGNVAPHHFVQCSNGELERTRNYWQIFRTIEWQLDLFLSEHVNKYYLLHAGAVAKNGEGIIMPGVSGSGKSTLTMALVRDGYEYLSDELAAIDISNGEVNAFPKPINIVDKSVFPSLASQDDLWFKPEAMEPDVWYIHSEDVRPNPLIGSVPVRYALFPKYCPSSEPRIQPLSKGDAIKALIYNAVNFNTFGRNDLALLAQLVEDAQCFTILTNGLDQTLALIDSVTGA